MQHHHRLRNTVPQRLQAFMHVGRLAAPIISIRVLSPSEGYRYGRRSRLRWSALCMRLPLVQRLGSRKAETRFAVTVRWR